MPELGKEITKRIDFPEYPTEDPAWVIVVVNPKKEAYLEANSATGDDKDAPFLAKIIKDWNFTVNGAKADITAENVTLALTGADRGLILKELGLINMVADLKKNS